MDDKTRTELEAAVYRRLVEHLRSRTDVQNIDMMNLAGFCRNCLSNWMKDAADAQGVPMSKDESRQIVYGMPYDEWRAKYQKEASPEQKAAFEKASRPRHHLKGNCRTDVDDGTAWLDLEGRNPNSPKAPWQSAAGRNSFWSA